MTAVKFVKGSPDLIEGLAIPFGGPLGGKDLDGEYFSAKTDLCLDWFDNRPLLYHHGLDGAVKAAVIGRVKSYEIKDDGLWVQAQLDKNSRYREVVGQLLDAEGLGFSSGTVSHLVETDAKTGEIKRWPWVEESLTPTPANPDALQVYTVKSTDLTAHLAAIETGVPAELVAAALKTLDSLDDDALPDGAKFADYLDRLTVDVAARVNARKDWRTKSGREPTAATKDQLRQLGGAIEELLQPAPSGDAKAALAVLAEFELQEARFNGVDVGKSAAEDVSDANYALNCVLRLITSETQDLDPSDPDYAEDQADIALLEQVRDLLVQYVASTVKEVGSPDDLADVAEEEARRALLY